MSSSPGSSAERNDEREVSLEELGRAYAEALRGVAPAEPAAEQPSHQASEQSEETITEDQAPAEAERADEPRSGMAAKEHDPVPVSPQTILEAMLFVGHPENRPLSCQRAAELMRGVEPGDIPQLVQQLNRRYAARGCPYHIVSVGDGYRLALRKKFHPLRLRFYGKTREARLSQAAIDVLAIVAYRQPISAEEVNRLRGTSSNHVLAQLVRRQLLRVERPEGSRRAVYSVTDRFLRLFGLESLDDLPQAEDLDMR